MRPFTAKIADPEIDAGGGVVLTALALGDRGFLDRLLSERAVSDWYDANSDDMLTHIEEPMVSPFLVRLNGAPLGYAQAYWANGDAFWRELGMPSETMGFDLALLPAHHGRGLGPRVVRALIRRAFEMTGVVQAIIDPAPENVRAIRAYTACGFTFGPPQPGYDEDPMVLGVLRRQDWTDTAEH